MGLKQCSVCGKKFLNQGLRNHIIGEARQEGFRHLFNMLIASRNKSYQFSPMVLRQQAKHLNYLIKNYKLTKKMYLEI